MYSLSLHDALPISFLAKKFPDQQLASLVAAKNEGIEMFRLRNHILQFEGQISVGRVRRTSRSSRYVHVSRRQRSGGELRSSGEVHRQDRKSTRLNSSHLGISYAVFCLKK